MPPKKNESESEVFVDAFTKMTEMFERFTKTVVNQINSNFTKHTDMLASDIFELNKNWTKWQRKMLT